MKQFELINGEQKVTFNFPTSLNEITKEYLDKVTENVKVADNYVLVGVVYHETLGSIIITRKQSKKSFTSGVVPVFVKAGKIDNEFFNNIESKDKLILSSQQISMGQHVVCPSNVLSLDCFIKHLDKDTTVAQRYANNYGKEECYFVEFKLIPACEIVGYYKSNKIELDNTYYNSTPIEG